MPGRSMVTGTPAKEKFTGKERDFGTGVMYYGTRYYDPQVGRFLQVDPLAKEYADMSPYNYVLNNPLKLKDPTGKCAALNIECIKAVYKMVNNSVKYASSMTKGTPRQMESRFNGELPQTALGALTFAALNLAGGVKDVTHYNGATVVETTKKDWGGMTLGTTIIVGADENIDSNPIIEGNGVPVVKHEFGHALQSQWLGKNYLPLVGVSSLWSASTNSYEEHQAHWTEKSADAAAKRYFGTENEQEDEDN